MDSEDGFDDEEEATASEVVDWYKNEVKDLWTQSTESAFGGDGDLSSNLTAMFQQVMNDVRQRNQPSDTSTPSSESNGHSSVSNGNSSSVSNGTTELNPSSQPVNTISISSDQLMAMLQDDEHWLEEDDSKLKQQKTCWLVQATTLIFFSVSS